MRPKYKYDKNCHSGSSSEKENPDPKKRQMIYEANEAPSTEVVKEYKPGCDQYEAESQEKLQLKQITSTSTTENTNESTNESTNEGTKEVIEFKNQDIGPLRLSLNFKYVY